MTKYRLQIYTRHLAFALLLICFVALRPPAAVCADAAPAADSSEAKANYEEAVKQYNRGVELHQAGFYNKAIDAYQKAVTLYPRMEEAYSNLGGVYATQRSYKKAVEAFEKALAINPNRTYTLNGYGTVLYALGKVQEAKEMWTKAFTIDPGFASAYYNMGNALEGEKLIDQASRYYFKAEQANPNMADAYYRMGLIYNKGHHYAQAKFMLQRSTELEPDAEFSKEATKLIEAINKILEADTSDKDVKPKVIAPANAQIENAPKSDGVTLPQATTYTSKHSGLFKKHKKEKKVDMFIQQGTPPAAEDQDLKEKPAQ